jgi:hypothetical protein
LTQVIVRQNQLQPHIATAAAGSQEGLIPSQSGGRTPIPSPGRDSTLRYMVVVLPDLTQSTEGILTDHDWQYVLTCLANDRHRNVVAAYASQVLHLFAELKQQLSE